MIKKSPIANSEPYGSEIDEEKGSKSGASKSDKSFQQSEFGKTLRRLNGSHNYQAERFEREGIRRSAPNRIVFSAIISEMSRNLMDYIIDNGTRSTILSKQCITITRSSLDTLRRQIQAFSIMQSAELSVNMGSDIPERGSESDKSKKVLIKSISESISTEKYRQMELEAIDCLPEELLEDFKQSVLRKNILPQDLISSEELKIGLQVSEQEEKDMPSSLQESAKNSEGNAESEATECSKQYLIKQIKKYKKLYHKQAQTVKKLRQKLRSIYERCK